MELNYENFAIEQADRVFKEFPGRTRLTLMPSELAAIIAGALEGFDIIRRELELQGLGLWREELEEFGSEPYR